MSKLSAKANEHFVELKTFEVYDPSGTYVLEDENGVPFTVDMYAPQSKRIVDYDKRTGQQSLMQNARTNGAADKNLTLRMKRGAQRLSHAIKSWHPVSPDGEFIAEYAELSEEKRAELLLPSGEEGRDISWLSDQLSEFFNKGNFVILKTAKEPETTEKTETAS